MDFILHFNRTRAKPLPKSRTKAGMVVRPAPSSKSLPVDLPRKLNLTGSYGLLKLISKESLVRIVNSQLQGITSLNFQSKGSRSGKRDLIDKDHSQSAQSKLKLMTVDSWPSHGLVFEEADEDTSDDYYGHGQMEQGGKRSRSRRSWIWNQFFVIEEYTGPEPVLIGRLHTDMDRGDGRTKYKLRGEGAGSVFVIDEKTGNIHVTKPLDREEKDEYRLIATATDRQTDRALEPSSQFIIRVQDINDNPPIFEEGPYSATVPEMANIGTSIIQVTATDADDPTYGNSARLVYTLVQGQPYFSVDPQTGILRTAVPDMDRETQDQFLVVLQAKDMGGHLGGLSGTTTVTVRLADVNDNPPRFAQSMWSFSVSELAVAGAEVGRVSATDADLGENAKLEYTILEGETGDTFNITGLNQEAVIILNKPVDYESRSSYSFSVEVLNPTVDPRFLRRGPFKDRAAIRVAVLDADEPPRFSRTRYRLAVSENCPPACTVGRVSAVDPDTGLNTNIRFSIDPQSDPEALFRITPDSGLITTATELDREREQWHNVTVIATQRDSPSQVSRVVVAVETLDLNDNAPELDRQYTTAMCDSTSTGQVVQVLRAIDRDEGGNDSTVHFNIPPESGSALNFSIRESGGPTASLVLASPLLTLSRSPSSSLTLYVPLILRDGASGLTSTGTVTVSVCPCLRGGARAGEKEKQTEGDWDREAVCLPQQSSSPSPGLSTAALLAILACIGTLLAVSALSLSLRRQKRDSLSPLEEDDVRENIITYDDEGGGEADTAAFDITALQSAPHGLRRGSMAPLYGRFCYSSHTLPIRRSQAPFDPSVAELAYRFPGGQPDHSLVIQNQGAMVMPLEHNGVFIGPTEGRGTFGGILGYGGGWGPGVGRGGSIGGGHSLALRVGEFLRLRLAQVTFDPLQPPYDSVQVYGLEGSGSRAGSLSSLESEGEREADREEWGGGLEDWGPPFQKLAQLFREREKERDDRKEELDKKDDQRTSEEKQARGESD
uniref:Cadherin domain-containing protein n=1 Tax=Denticeps clupeoides TaxID=299321 RepID=A0AAY4ARQ7_9TELE